MGEMVSYPANGHTTSGYLALPAGGRGPGVLVIQEWWGLVDHIKSVADRFADAGFVALAPDFYGGKTTKSPDDAAKLFMALNIDRASKDLAGSAAYLLSRPETSSKRVGAVGFCMGGQLALYAGMAHPDRIGAVVNFYGIHPHVTVDPARLKVPVLGHFGEKDRSVPIDQMRDFGARVERAGGSFETIVYPADHAFFNDTRPEVYHEPSATAAWDRSVTFFKQHLG